MRGANIAKCDVEVGLAFSQGARQNICQSALRLDNNVIVPIAIALGEAQLVVRVAHSATTRIATAIPLMVASENAVR